MPLAQHAKGVNTRSEFAFVVPVSPVTNIYKAEREAKECRPRPSYLAVSVELKDDEITELGEGPHAEIGN